MTIEMWSSIWGFFYFEQHARLHQKGMNYLSSMQQNCCLHDDRVLRVRVLFYDFWFFKFIYRNLRVLNLNLR